MDESAEFEAQSGPGDPVPPPSRDTSRPSPARTLEQLLLAIDHQFMKIRNGTNSADDRPHLEIARTLKELATAIATLARISDHSAISKGQSGASDPQWYRDRLRQRVVDVDRHKQQPEPLEVATPHDRGDDGS